jgi:hypothetical protein
MNFALRLQQIDRRIIYAAVAVLVAIPLYIHFDFRAIPTRPVISLYDKIESLPPDKLVIISSDWGPDILAECRPQFRCLIEHMMRRRLKFAVMTPLPEGVGLAQAVCDDLAAKYGYVYGKDYVNWGYLPAYALAIIGLVKDIPGTISSDYQATPLADLPAMNGVTSIKDSVSMCLCVTGSASWGYWTTWVYGQIRTPIGVGVTGIIAPEIFPYLDSGQVSGLMAGMKGAAEYEDLLGERLQGFKAMKSQNMAHLLVILLIILGNIGFFAARKQTAGQQT